MPELPEVETIKLGLQRKIIGLKIKNLQVLYPKGVQFDPKEVSGKKVKVIGVWRRAKMLGVDLDNVILSKTKDLDSYATLQNDNKLTLLFHLKMTGQLIFVHNSEKLIGGHPTEDMKGQMPNKSTVAVFEFSDGSSLYFNDQRRFGWIKLFETQEVKADNFKKLGKLGPEPFDSDFTWEVLKTNLMHHKLMPIKVAIMDQSVISGVGNIYASESLFEAKIDPRRKVNSLSDLEFKKLYQGIKKSLETGIKHGGSTRAHFVNVEGEKGYFLDYANVYGKEGQKCHDCSGKVEKIKQAGRGTYWCPSCQK